MGILWCGGEDIDFPTFTGCVMDGSALVFRSGYARGAIKLSTAPAGKSTQFPGGAVTSCWLSYRFKHAASASCRAVGLGKYSVALKGLYFGSNSSNGAKASLWTYDGSTWTIAASEAGTSLSSALHKIDIQVVDFGDEGGVVRCYVDSVLVIEYIGDVSVTDVDELDCVLLGYGGGAGNGSEVHVSEVIVADSSTLDMSLVTHYPNDAGDLLEWTGAYSTIDELTISDADLAYDNTVGHKAEYKLSDSPAGTFSVLAVKEIVRAVKSSDSTPTHLKIGVKSGSVEGSPPSVALTTAWARYERYMSVNPVTTNSFSTTELDALQLVLESDT